MTPSSLCSTMQWVYKTLSKSNLTDFHLWDVYSEQLGGKKAITLWLTLRLTLKFTLRWHGGRHCRPQGDHRAGNYMEERLLRLEKDWITWLGTYGSTKLNTRKKQLCQQRRNWDLYRLSKLATACNSCQSCWRLVTAANDFHSLYNSCQSWQQLIIAVKADNSLKQLSN